MKKILLLLLFVNCIFAENNDSLKTYKGFEVVISANRTETLVKNSSSFLNLLKSEDLDKTNGLKLADKIQNLSSVVLKDYGYGGLKTISMRGMSSEHTLILLNGERINSDQNGMFDLNNLLIDEVERIEVIKGGSSAYYGSNAIGGLINIIPKQKFDEQKYKIGFTYGSNNYKKILSSISGNFLDFNYSLSFIKEKSDNDYKYKYNDRGVIFEGNRKNANFDIYQLSLNINRSISNFSINFYSNLFDADRSIPNMVTVNISKAQQTDKDFIAILQTKYNSENLLITFSPSFRYLSYDYKDPMLSDGISFVHGNAKTYRKGISSNLNYIYNKNIIVIYGFEYYHNSIDCINYSDIKNRNQFSNYLGFEINALNIFKIFPALRYDYYTDFGFKLSPKIGVNVNLYNQLFFLKTNYSKNYRVPTFNDLYWNPGGNPNLKAEVSNSFDVGLSLFDLSLSEFLSVNFDVNYFYIFTKDRIFWMPFSGSLWKPKNIKKAESSGIESEIEINFFDRVLNLNANYTYTKAINKTEGDINKDNFLPFIPEHIFRTGVIFNYWKISTGMNFRFTSSFYSEESNNKLSRIEYYHIADLFLNFKTNIYGIISSFKFEVNNLYNSEYIVIPYYPTPLRDFKFTILINI